MASGLALSLGEAAYRLLSLLNNRLDVMVVGGGVSRSVYRYSLNALAASASTGVLGAVLASSLAALHGLPPALAPVAGLLGFIAGFTLSLGFLVSLPGLAYRSRGSKLEPRFPLLATALATRLFAGTPLAQAILDVYERDLPDLPEFRVEIEYLASRIRLGVEVGRALEEAAELTPSPSLRSLFASLAVAARTGTGVAEIVDTLLREYLFNVETEIDRVTSGLGALLELFVSASVMLPIAIGVVGLLLIFQFGAAPPPWLNFNTLLFVSTFILVPMVSAAVIIIADSMVSRVRI